MTSVRLNAEAGVATKDKLSLKDLRRLLSELEDMMIRCMRCGFCQQVCPVYGATFKEADVTRGKIALLQDLAEKLTDDADAVGDRLNRCLLCTSCESVCPSGVGIMDIFIKARAIVAGYQGLGVIKKLIFRFLLPHPDLFNQLMMLSSIFQYPFLRKENETVESFSLPLMGPILGERHIPKLPVESFSMRHGFIDEEPKESGIKVAFFPGCVPDKIFLNISEATIKVLRHHGVGIFMPEGLVCCGIPLLSSGDRKGFLRLLAKNLATLQGGDFDYLLTSCATCASTLGELWPRFKTEFTGGDLSFLESLEEKTVDITSFLVNVLKIPLNQEVKKQETKRVTYHDPCHLRRSKGIYKEPREILKSLLDYQFCEMPEADRCCGNGGSFNLFHYDISKDIAQRKRDNIVSVDPEVVTTSCPACLLQIMDVLSQNGDNIQARHVVELYAESLDK
ncbi:MAG: (Fe-S)-binding protein [Deltaproteobacteria bacterium]|jgi:glycolate oxidase iron-sulfur subunit|nr:(Fe-S)-binding protein [Deltaproteobacteria bacterium]